MTKHEQSTDTQPMTSNDTSGDVADSIIPINANRVNVVAPTAQPRLDNNPAAAELLQAMTDLSAKLTQIAQALAECQAAFRGLAERMGVSEPSPTPAVTAISATDDDCSDSVHAEGQSDTLTCDVRSVRVFDELIRWIKRHQPKQRHFAPMATSTVESIKRKHAQLQTSLQQQKNKHQHQPLITQVLESLLEDATQLDELISQEKPESAAARAMRKIRDGLVKLICDYGPYVEIRAASGDTLSDWPQPLDDYLAVVPVPHPTIPRGQVVRTIRPGYQLRQSGEVVQLAIVHISA